MNNNEKLKAQKGTGIKRAAFERSFAARYGFTFSFGKPLGGQPNRIGRLHGCAVQLIGPADNLTGAGLILPLSQHDPLSVIRARQYLKAFFDLVPSGAAGPAWFEQNVYQATVEKEIVISHQGLNISLNGLATSDGLVATLMVSKA